jgi:hypothetical protein
MPKVSISLSSDVASVLVRSGKTLNEKVKEIVLLYVARSSRILERSDVLHTVALDLLTHIKQYLGDPKPEGLYMILAEAKILAMIAKDLPLTEGEKFYLAILEAMIEAYYEKRSTIIPFFEPTIAGFIALLPLYVLSLVIDVKEEVKTSLENPVKLATVMMDALISYANKAKPSDAAQLSATKLK